MTILTVDKNWHSLRYSLLLMIAISLILIGCSVGLYPPLLMMPGSLLFLVEPIALLIIYAALIFLFTKIVSPLRHTALTIGTIFGIATSALQAIHLLLETFGGLANGRVTLAFMLGTFLLWGVSGYLSSRRNTSQISQGVLTGGWSAMVCMLIAVMLGFTLMHVSPPQPEEVANWAEFKRSAWTDARAFAIANTLDSGFTHLLIGPLIGALFGGVAGSINATLGRARSGKLASSLHS